MISRSIVPVILALASPSLLLAEGLQLAASNYVIIRDPYALGSVPLMFNNINLAQFGGDAFRTSAPPQSPGYQIEVFGSGSQAGHPVGGVPDTYQPKYDDGYHTGYSTGYSTGLSQGQQRGQSEGTATGKSDGYNAGWSEAYQPAFDLAYANAQPLGQEAAWKQGLLDGFTKGYDWAIEFAGSLTLSNNNPNHGYWSSGSLMITGGNNWSGGDLNWTHTISVEDLSAFYYKLGCDDGNKNGLVAGDSDGYDATYPAAYAAAYPLGHELGTSEGHSYGIQNGKEAGFDAGWKTGYGPGYDGGFAAGIQYFRSGDFSLPSYSAVFGTAMPSQIPEPASFTLLAIALAPVALRRRREN